MTGRSVSKYTRIYADGFDLSGYTRTLGPLTWEYDTAEDAALTDAVKGALPGNAKLSPTMLNGFFDNTAVSGLHVVASGAGVERCVMIPLGRRGPPVAGDPVYMGQFTQLGYQAEKDDNWMYANLTFGMAATGGAISGKYTKPWGVLLHAQAARTAANTAIGLDDNGAASAFGGYLCYQLFSVIGVGSVTIKVQDAAANNDAGFADLSGATSGAIAHTAAPRAGLVALGTTAAVRRYLRYQVVLTGITSATFALGFVRSLAQGV